MQDCLIDELFIIDDVIYYPYKKDECLMYAPRKNLSVKLSNLDVENALACKQFLTIDEHVEALFNTLSYLNQSKNDIRDSVTKLVEKEILITPKDFIKGLGVTKNSQKPSRITTDAWKQGWVLAICSADRPDLISRLLTTLVPHLDDISIKPLIVFADDSRSNASTEKNLESLKAFCQENELEYEFWDRQRRTLFCDNLGEKIPNTVATIDYLLSPKAHSEEDGITIGQARNFAILRSSGKPLLMIDDDCLLNPLQDLNYDCNLSLGYSGRRALVKSSYDELFISFEKSQLNPLLEHLKMLGNPLDSILIDRKDDFEDPFFWKDKTKEMLNEMCNAKFVGLSINSIVGALNSRQMNWFYSLNKQDTLNAEKLLDSLDDNIHQSIDQATWSGKRFDEMGRSIPFFGTTICGVAPLPLVPPMPPCGRNEDLALGAMVRFLYQESQVYQFGWALPHLPDPQREWQPFQDQQEPEYNSTSFIILLLLVLEKNCPSSIPEQRLEYFSLYLSHITKSELASLLKNDFYGHHSHSILQIKESAKAVDQNSRYRIGCEKMIQYHLNGMKNINQDVAKIEKDVLKLAKPFSNSLSQWPTIWRYCSHSKDVFQ